MPTNTNKGCIEGVWIPFVVCVHIRNIYYLFSLSLRFHLFCL